MANALRRRAPARSRQSAIRAGGESVSINGSYNIDLKITVEWQRELGTREIEALLVAFLDEPRSPRDVRAFLSGHLRASDADLLPGKISRYRIAPNSLRALLGILETRGTITRHAGTESAEVCWLATKNVA